ncbi:High affinity cationic amino acid transporter 1 [Halocaridina rubra]|uniref:High affinity cationic amino acid transporter 1 n=1 Tax=Halocaridina rubra TaxID=373956 RepID=A0AAN9A824_HALRR
MPSFLQRITRKKIVDLGSSELNRALTLFDLTLLGIGSTVGVGFYVLAGNVARSIAGPAVVVSFLIAGIASLFAGLCYAEFGARVPKAGSAYIYSYVCVGELVAFVIGWNLLLEYVIGASSVARGYSGYVDALANNSMSEALKDAMPLDVDFLSDYPDFLAFGLCFFISALLAIGIKESSTMNNIFTGLNIIVIIYVIIAAATQADVANWQLTELDINETCEEKDEDGNDIEWGTGGFSPYGFPGIMRGAATCFFGFVGFDCIATTGEEAINPSRNIPLSISLSLFVIFLAYFGMASTLTLALAYCLQDPDAPLVEFFEALGWETAKWIVSIGAIFGFSASLIGVLLPLPRIVYAMANDGIIFRFLSKVNKRFKTPLLATMSSGLLAGIMAMFFDLESLVDMMSIGTLMAYTIVAVSVMLLRYVPESSNDPSSLLGAANGKKGSTAVGAYSTKNIMRQLLNMDNLQEPTEFSGSVASYATLVFSLLVGLLSLLLVVLQEKLYEADVGAIVGVCIVFILNVVVVFFIGRQPQSKKSLSFKVPFVPWLPALSSIVNVYLMFNLSPDTWIRFAVWMGIGFPIYFFYGICHSSEENRGKDGKFGLDNPGGPNDGSKNHLFVIPTIQVQLATPQNSAPNTPKTIHSEKIDPPPESSSAPSYEEMQMIGNEDPEKKDDTITKIEEDNAIAMLDEVVASRLSCISTDSSQEQPASSNDSEKPKDEVQSRELPPIPVENLVDEPDRNSEESNSVSSDPGYEPIGKVDSEKLQLASEGDFDSDQNDPHYQTIEEVKVQGETEQKSSLNGSDNDPENLKALLMAELLQKVSNPPHEDKNEAPYAKVIKKDKKTPDPLVVSTDQTDTEEALKRFSSAPIITSSLPSSPRTHHSTTSLGSVPSTPVTRRHPTKVLKRNSSFDLIPPSPLDSPLARRIDKFFIIPVKEPSLPGSDSNPQTKTEVKAANDENLNEEVQPKRNMFYVGSEDSLENLALPEDSQLSDYSREVKRLSNKETFLSLEGLDTIRERGESKVTIDDLPIDTSVSALENLAEITQKGSDENAIKLNEDINGQSQLSLNKEHNNSQNITTATTEKLNSVIELSNSRVDIDNPAKIEEIIKTTSPELASSEAKVSQLRSLFGS